MNYDHFERQVLMYGGVMSSRAERRRRLRGTPVSRRVSVAGAGHPVRLHLAVALRSLADHLDTRPARLA